MKRLATLILFVSALCASCARTRPAYFSERTLASQREAFARELDQAIVRWNGAAQVDPGQVKGLVWRIAAFNRYDRAAGAIAALKATFESFDAGQRYAVLSLLCGKDSLLDADEARAMASAPGMEHAQGELRDLMTWTLYLRGAEVPAPHAGSAMESLLDGSYAAELDGPDFDALYAWSVARGCPLLLLRADRDLPGVMLVADGSDEPLCLSFLGRSSYDLPSFMPYGNTPCGVYALEGTEVSDNVFIGPVANLQTRLPFEAAPGVFGLPGAAWSVEAYASLLPPQLSASRMMRQAWDAGESGRTEIIVHGSTIDPDFFAGEPYWPLTPSLGCMTALQLWDPATGQPVENADAMQCLLEHLRPDARFLYVAQVTEEIILKYKTK